MWINFKANSDVNLERKEESWEKVFIFLGDAWEIMHRILVEIWRMNAKLQGLRQKWETCYWNWEEGNSYDEIIKNFAEWCSYFSVFSKIGLVSDEIGHFAKNISKQTVLRVAWFFY
jgi:hypothetical protein